jgi:hypothetical protein
MSFTPARKVRTYCTDFYKTHKYSKTFCSHLLYEASLKSGEGRNVESTDTEWLTPLIKVWLSGNRFLWSSQQIYKFSSSSRVCVSNFIQIGRKTQKIKGRISFRPTTLSNVSLSLHRFSKTYKSAREVPNFTNIGRKYGKNGHAFIYIINYSTTVTEPIFVKLALNLLLL